MVEVAFGFVGVKIVWQGQGESEVGIDSHTGAVRVAVDPAVLSRCLMSLMYKFYRPAEVDYLQGNPAKAKAKLGWSPKTSFAVCLSDNVHVESL
jgi:GDPmannose 4,6-dehydratase